MIILQHSYVFGSRMVSVGDNGQGVSYPRSNPPKAQQLKNNKQFRRRARNGLVKNETSEEQVNQKKVVLGSQKTKKTQTNRLAQQRTIAENVSPKMDVKSLDVCNNKEQCSLVDEQKNMQMLDEYGAEVKLYVTYQMEQIQNYMNQAQEELLWEDHDVMSQMEQIQYNTKQAQVDLLWKEHDIMSQIKQIKDCMTQAQEESLWLYRNAMSHNR